MSIIAAILLCIAVTFHIIALAYLYRFIRCRVWGDERYPSLGQFQVSMKGFASPEKGRFAASLASLPSSEVPSFPPHWAPSAFSNQGVDPNIKMPRVFKVRVGDGKHPEDEKEFVGMADSPEQAVQFALSMVSDCEVPLVFSVERISVLDI